MHQNKRTADRRGHSWRKSQQYSCCETSRIKLRKVRYRNCTTDRGFGLRVVADAVSGPKANEVGATHPVSRALVLLSGGKSQILPVWNCRPAVSCDLL